MNMVDVLHLSLPGSGGDFDSGLMHFSLEDDHESVRETAQRPDARRRLIPFSAMIGVGVVVTLLWHVAAVYWFDR